MRFSFGPSWVPAAVVGLGVAGVWFTLRPSGQAVPRVASSSIPTFPIPAQPSGGPHVSLTFWNVQWFPGHRPDAGAQAQATHVAAVLPVLQQLDPDVLGLEEVGDADAARLLTDHLPGPYRVDVCSEFTRDPTGEPSRQQIALCSRLPLLTSGWQRWTPDAQGHTPRRGFAFAAYRLASGDVLLVYGLHLKSNLADEPGGDATNTAMREESTRQLLAHERQESAFCSRWGRVRLVVVGGDMNTSLDDGRFASERTLRTLRDDGKFRWAWENIPLSLRLTLPGAGPYPPACFDHFFYRSEDAHLASAFLSPTDRNASDHRPINVRFEW